ncbi:RagB/SusD family nutrient uptake outer membrane protein [Flavobacterium phragmitis]|uniref:SusD family protein n=1 Tax=Flavobacterium phragmitis TaxID=739143 RepID=A0A1I1WVL6_9FLAO|nr:RagB/SusD family nutrient uptake outer membrane protein [Flavobacterium phragmitis]SFD99061.1 SusD family protein [Flavobacterium phragmitis]
MKKIKHIKFIYLCICSLSIASCSIDEVKPINQLTDENVIRDKESAQNALNGVYKQWREYNTGFLPIHLAAEGNEGFITGAISGSTGMNLNQVDPDNDYLSSVYNNYYAIINQANIVIEKLENGGAVGIDEPSKLQMIAQSKFNRALAYFNLLRNFGQFYDLSSNYGVVVRTKFSRDVEAQKRNTVQETYNLIIQDLEYAVTNGPKNVKHYYGGSLAAKALLAKVKLTTKDYTSAATLALEVINNTENYALETSYAAIFTNTYNSKEVIFAPYTNLNTTEKDVSMNQINRTTYSTILEKVADAQVAGAGNLTGNGSGYDSRFLFAYSANTKGTNKQGKYPFNSSGNTGVGNTNYYLRMAEMYLIYAEAIVRSNGDSSLALSKLNAIRNRSGATAKVFTTKEQLLKDIREEKLLELFFENGECWYDLIRYHALGDVSAFTEKPSLKSVNQFILPIPLKAMIGNKLLEKNPGY